MHTHTMQMHTYTSEWSVAHSWQTHTDILVHTYHQHVCVTHSTTKQHICLSLGDTPTRSGMHGMAHALPQGSTHCNKGFTPTQICNEFFCKKWFTRTTKPTPSDNQSISYSISQINDGDTVLQSQLSLCDYIIEAQWPSKCHAWRSAVQINSLSWDVHFP